MQTLDDFFKQTEEVPLHPRLRQWKRQRDEGADLRLELSQHGKAIGNPQVEMNLLSNEAGQEKLIETLAWDEDLNAGLVQLQVKAVNRSNEAERFALALRGALRKVSQEFGDGYFNGVLLELIKDSDLTEVPEIREVVKHAYGNPPQPGATSTMCRQMIADAIRGRARELNANLQYSEEEAKIVLTEAIARYLDERFSVSSRRRMGLL